MTLHQLKVFTLAAKLGSFTEAGVTFNLRQPSVTALVQGLERDLKVKLFDRMGNKIRLTGAGERLLHLAKEMLAKADQITEEMDEIRGLEIGKLSVGASFTPGASFVPLAIQTFKRQFPGIDLHLKVDRSRTLEKNLLEGTVDLAILSHTPESPLLIGKAHRIEDIVIIAPPNHPLAKKRSVPLELLAKESFIMSKKGSHNRKEIEQAFAEKGLSLKIVLEVDVHYGTRDAAMTSVASGIGLAVNHMCHVIGDVKLGRLAVLNVPELKLKRTMNIVVRKNRESSSLILAFINFLDDYKDIQG